MGLNVIKVKGADLSVTNLSGNNYAAVLQVSAARSRLFKLSLGPLAGMAVDVYAWIFDLAAGSGSSAAPVMVRWAAAGLGDTWDFGPDGAVFANGIYVALSTVPPTDGTTTPTTSGNNKAIVKAEYRVGI